MFTDFIEPNHGAIHSQKDEEWNQKLREFIGEGRLEDVAQLSREIHRQVRVQKVVSFKPMWWLSAFMGQNNQYKGDVLAYAPVYGVGAAVCSLTPSPESVGDKEFDEEDVEVYRGDRQVLTSAEATASGDVPARAEDRSVVRTDEAPRPVGAYPHARRVGDLLYLSGIGPRDPKTDAIPGGAIRDSKGSPLEYDVEKQTRACIENVRVILEAAGSSIDLVLDVTVFLVDMDRDFAAFNRVYTEYFASVGAARTTVAVRALPTPIAVELKVLAAASAKAEV